MKKKFEQKDHFITQLIGEKETLQVHVCVCVHAYVCVRASVSAYTVNTALACAIYYELCEWFFSSATLTMAFLLS